MHKLMFILNELAKMLTRDQIDATIPLMENRELLYLGAVNRLGTDASPNDKAPDSLACAECVEDVYYGIFGEYIGMAKTLSTGVLRRHLKESPNFIQVTEPSEGSIIISATGLGNNKAIQHGHVGIVGKNRVVMSNTSKTGMWDENYTIDSWTRYFSGRGGYPVEYFNRI